MANEAELADHSRTILHGFKEPSEAEHQRWRKQAGTRSSNCAKFTYFMRDKRTGYIKIGMAFDPSSRRARLNSSGFHKVEILATVRDGDFEASYHRHFDQHRLHGEWFEPHPDILAEIERLVG